MALAVVAASVVILTAGYILWTIQRVYLGPEYKGPHAEALTPMTRREVAIAAPLLALAILFGVYPAGAVRLHDAERGQDRGRAWPPGPNRQRAAPAASRRGAEQRPSGGGAWDCTGSDAGRCAVASPIQDPRSMNREISLFKP